MIASIFTLCLANTSCFAPQKRIEIEFGKQAYRQKEREMDFLAESFAVYDAVTELSVSTWIYLHIQVVIGT